jgi:hypothetical protein
VLLAGPAEAQKGALLDQAQKVKRARTSARRACGHHINGKACPFASNTANGAYASLRVHEANGRRHGATTAAALLAHERTDRLLGKRDAYQYALGHLRGTNNGSHAAAIAHLTGQLQLAMDSTGGPGGGASGERQQPAERRGVPALADELQHPAPARAAADALLRRLTEDEPLKRAKHPCRRHCAHCTAGGLPCAFSVRSDKHRPYAALVAHEAAPAERKGGGRGGGTSNCHGWATQGDREYAAAANQLLCLLDHLQYTRASLAGRTAIVDIAVCSIDAQCQTYAILLGAVMARLAEGKEPRQVK